MFSVSSDRGLHSHLIPTFFIVPVIGSKVFFYTNTNRTVVELLLLIFNFQYSSFF